MRNKPQGPTQAIVSISDPWEFQDENDGTATFHASVVTLQGNTLILRLDKDAYCDGKAWTFVVPFPRWVDCPIQSHRKDVEFPADFVFFDNRVLRMTEKELKQSSHSNTLPGAMGTVKFT